MYSTSRIVAIRFSAWGSASNTSRSYRRTISERRSTVERENSIFPHKTTDLILRRIRTRTTLEMDNSITTTSLRTRQLHIRKNYNSNNITILRKSISRHDKSPEMS